MHGPDELREGPAGAARPRLARRVAGPVPERPGGREGVNATPDALAIAERALALRPGRRRGGHRHRRALRVRPLRRLGGAPADADRERHRRAPPAPGRASRAGGDEPHRRRGPRRARARRAAAVLGSASPNDELPRRSRRRRRPRRSTAYDEATAALDAGEQARLAAAAIAAAGDIGLYGYFTSGVCDLAIASSTGLRASQRTTDATCLALAAGEDTSGYAERTSWRAADIDPAAVAEEAVGEGGPDARRAGAEPARYRAVLEPYAIAELLLLLLVRQLQRARAARGAELLRRADRGAGVRPEGHARRRRARRRTGCRPRSTSRARRSSGSRSSRTA